VLDESRFNAVLKVMSRKQIRAAVECADSRISILHGAVSSGKTIASLLAFLIAVAQAPRAGALVVAGRTLQTIERNLFDVLMEPFGPFGPFARFVQHTRGANTATIFGRTVWLIGASDVRAEARIRGLTAALIYADELALMPESFFVMCLSRLRVPGAKLIATSNPEGPAHWLRQKFLLRETELNLRQWHFDLEDNPSLTEEYKAAIRAEYTGLWYERYVKGRWCLAEGAIYDMFDPARHVVQELPPIIKWIGLGVDYGTVNPFAAELLGLGADGVLYVGAEWYHDSKTAYRQLTDDDYSQAVRDWLEGLPIPGSDLTGIRPDWTVIDPSATSFRLRLHQDGLTTVLGDNAVLPGIRTVASLLATGRLKVHASCEALIAELPGYAWDPKAAARGEDAPLKTGDHCLDAVRYVVRRTEPVWRYRLRPPAVTPE
jgi:PBSX family phage terminase large subunit